MMSSCALASINQPCSTEYESKLNRTLYWLSATHVTLNESDASHDEALNR